MANQLNFLRMDLRKKDLRIRRAKSLKLFSQNNHRVKANKWNLVISQPLRITPKFLQLIKNHKSRELTSLKNSSKNRSQNTCGFNNLLELRRYAVFIEQALKVKFHVSTSQMMIPKQIQVIHQPLLNFLSELRKEEFLENLLRTLRGKKVENLGWQVL